MIRFILDKKKGQESPVFLSLYHFGKRYRVFTGKKIDADKWDFETRRAHPKKYKTNPQGFNEYLQNIENEVVALTNANKPISKADIVTIVATIIAKASGKETSQTFFGFAADHLQKQIGKGGMMEASAKAYRVTLNHLKRLTPALDFKDVDLDYYDKFVTYLRNKGISTNSIGGHVKRLKWFMAAALDRDLHTNVAFKKKAFAATSEDSDQVYLTRKEIAALAKKKLPERLKKVADAFVINCYLGQRYSDWAQLKPENFTTEEDGQRWNLVQDKTGEKISVPVPDEVLPLLKKYKKTCPVISKKGKLMSVQKFNDYIKEAAEAAGLDALEDIRSNGQVNKVAKFNLIKSHTSRRTYATNLYLEGAPIQDIMSGTGHKKEQTFLLYVRANQLEKSKGLAKFYAQRRESSPTMKVTRGGRAA